MAARVTANCYLTIKGGNFAGGINTVKNDRFGVLTINGGNFSEYCPVRHYELEQG